MLYIANFERKSMVELTNLVQTPGISSWIAMLHVFYQIGVGNNNQFDVFFNEKIAKRGICIESAITSVSVTLMFINIKR